MRVIKALAAACGVVASAALAADDGETIRALRAESNAGILAHQADKAVTGAADDFVVVRGSSGAAFSGKTVVRDTFAEGFKDPNFVTYIRTSRQITVSDDGARAVEHGTWQGVYHDSLMGGDYQAHWSKRDGKWLDRAEIYVTLQCQGPVCKP